MNDDLARVVGDMTNANERQSAVLSVAQLNRRVAQLLEDGVPTVAVQGEVSNFTAAASGHWYFTLKDERAAVRAVMFRSRAHAVGFVPRAGDRVQVRARVSLYEARGDYQLQVDTLQRAGLGDLYEAFMRLKATLAAEGLFDAARKRTPAAMPTCVGVVTSLAAAALRDVLSALARRAPHVAVVVYPAPVQGGDAATKLAGAIAAANRASHADTLLLVRGGGSIEDLWSFNDERLARAIAASRIPVISGVGHETDFTIADFVADLRAPTPTAAAELACAPREHWLAQIAQAGQRIARAQARRLSDAAQKLDRLSARLISPSERLTHQRERLTGLTRRLTTACAAPLANRQARLTLAHQRLGHARPDLRQPAARLAAVVQTLAQAQRRALSNHQLRLQHYAERLRALDPQLTLARGYAIVRDDAGDIVCDAARLAAGQGLAVQFARGEARVSVVGGAGSKSGTRPQPSGATGELF